MTGQIPMLFGIKWMEPDWLLQHFGTQFFWISLVMIFVECGLFFPFLPGDTLLFAMGLFVATDKVDIVPGPPGVDLVFSLLAFTVMAFLGNVTGYEIGRRIGPPLYERDGRILKRKYFDNTSAFFAQHGNKALVIGRFVAFVRTYVTVVAGVTRMPRRRFLTWSFVGALLWVLLVTLLGYFLGNVPHVGPFLGSNMDYAVIVIIVVSMIPVAIEYLRHRRGGQKATEPDAADSTGTGTKADTGAGHKAGATE